jgi:hypothetical protein
MRGSRDLECRRFRDRFLLRASPRRRSPRTPTVGPPAVLFEAGGITDLVPETPVSGGLDVVLREPRSVLALDIRFPKPPLAVGMRLRLLSRNWDTPKWELSKSYGVGKQM